MRFRGEPFIPFPLQYKTVKGRDQKARQHIRIKARCDLATLLRRGENLGDKLSRLFETSLNDTPDLRIALRFRP